jgi:hypothetical protein
VEEKRSGGSAYAGFPEGHRHGIGRIVFGEITVGIVVCILSVVGLVIGGPAGPHQGEHSRQEDE